MDEEEIKKSCLYNIKCCPQFFPVRFRNPDPEVKTKHKTREFRRQNIVTLHEFYTKQGNSSAGNSSRSDSGNLGLLAKHSHFMSAIPSHNYLPRSRICSIPCFGGWAFCLKSPRLYCHLLLLPPPPPFSFLPHTAPLFRDTIFPPLPPFHLNHPPGGI